MPSDSLRNDRSPMPADSPIEPIADFPTKLQQLPRDDLAQEIWHAALKTPNAAAAHPARLRAWLTGIARHLAALLHRRDARRTRRELAAAATNGHVRSADRAGARTAGRPRTARLAAAAIPPHPEAHDSHDQHEECRNSPVHGR